MNLKKIVSYLLIASTLSIALPTKKAEAGVIMISALPLSSILCEAPEVGYFTGPITLLGIPVTIAGIITAFFNPYVGVGLIVLSENGAFPQNDLEQVLAQKYSFIQDPIVFADLATIIKKKSEQVTPVDGKTLVSLSETEIISILESTDLLETHSNEIKQMINELK